MTIPAAISSVKTSVYEYVNQIPGRTLHAAGQAFIISFVGQTLITESVKNGLIGGGCAVVATLIHALTSPLFKSLFATRGNELTEILRSSVSVIGASLVAAACGNQSYMKGPMYFYSVIHGLILPSFNPDRLDLNNALMICN